MEGYHKKREDFGARLDMEGISLDASNIQLSRVRLQDELFVPNDVWLESRAEPRIGWDEHNISRCTRPIANCLQSFIRIADGTDQAYLDFAKHWGVLGLRPDVIPLDHPGGAYRYSEPISLWRRLAQCLRAILAIAADALADRPTRIADWKKVVDLEAMYPDQFLKIQEQSLDPIIARRMIGCEMSVMLGSSSMTPVLDWGDGPPELTLRFGGDPVSWDMNREKEMENRRNRRLQLILTRVSEADQAEELNGMVPDWEAIIHDDSNHRHRRPSNLFDLLLMQVAMALMSQTGLYRCSHCDTPFNPKNRRRGSNRQTVFCDVSAINTDDPEWCRKQGHLLVASASIYRRRAKEKAAKS